jgi:hypothetical protein
MDMLERLYANEPDSDECDDDCCDDGEDFGRCCEGPDDCDCYECDDPAPRRRDIFDDFDDGFDDVIGDFDKGFDDIFGF